MSEYAQHIASHTSAIKDLNGASQELQKSVAEQNKVLASLSEAIQGMQVNRRIDND